MRSDKKVNVLVCRDAGATVNCVNQCLYTLRRLLSPRYAVIPITARSLVTEPWEATCALLVLPGGADLGYCRAFNGPGNQAIRRYVQTGGSFLGFCAGGYYGSSKCEFEVGSDPKKGMEVIGDRELAFFPGPCRGSAFGEFQYDSELGAKAVLLRPQVDHFVEEKKQSAPTSEPAALDSTPFRVYFNGGGVFVNARSTKDTEILATYGEPVKVDPGDGIQDGQEGAAAVIYCKVRHPVDENQYGNVVLSGVHPEFATVNLDREISVPGYLDLINALKKDEHRRVSFLILSLRKLGLVVPDIPISSYSLSNLHLSSIESDGTAKILSQLSSVFKEVPGDGLIPGAQAIGTIKGEVDQFVVYNSSGDSAVENVSSPPTVTTGLIDYSKVVKHLLVHEGGKLPSGSQTPKFDHRQYYDALLEAYDEAKAAYPGDVSGDLGKCLLYGQVVTSTNTLLEKNPTLLEQLPHGLSFVATNQVAGRGRGSNPWVSPTGSSILSVVLHLPLPSGSTASSAAVFVQYLASIAVMRAIHGFGALNEKRTDEDLPVAIKWPNDIYARPPGTEKWLKIGGILVQTSYSPSANCLTAIMGVGINVSVPTDPASAVPTISLNEVAELCGLAPFKVEELVARQIVGLDAAVTQFEKYGWKGVLEKEYINSWLHSNQFITIDRSVTPDNHNNNSTSTVQPSSAFSLSSTTGSSSSSPVLHARIRGLTSDWGELLVEEEKVEIQAGGNDDNDDRKRLDLTSTTTAASSSSMSQATKRVTSPPTAGRPTGKFWRLQPDNNSFDFFSGLIVKRM